MLGAVGALGIGATSAIFSDSEASTGNTFTAGAVDLTVDNESYYNGQLNASTTWLEPADLDDGNGPADGAYLFFNFDDVKPGDYGEDTISLHVNNNDSWLCVDVTLTSDDDNGLTEPEADDGDNTSGVGEGELADAIDFIWWADDGDNVYESDEVLLPAGPLGNLAVGETATVPLADSNVNIWDGDGPLAGDSVRYIGKGWCLGVLTPDPVTQDNATTSGPLERGEGFTCDGAPVDNVTQTDSMSADIVFYAEQARHNDQFVCGGAPDDETTLTVVKVVDNSAGGSATTSDFTLFIDGATTTSGVAVQVATGTYTVSENSLPNYVASFSGDCDGGGSVTVGDGEQAVCTITNTYVEDPMGQITVDKSIAITSSSTSVTVDDFVFTMFGPLGSPDATSTEVFDIIPAMLLAGDYVLSEEYVGVDPFVFDTIFTGDCTQQVGTSTAADVTIDEDGVHSCGIINTELLN